MIATLFSLILAANAASTPPPATCCAVVELRQYTLNPYKRETFINLFEDRFIESQEAVGINLIGEFRQVGMPNKFYWIRGFPSMPARAKALQAFYYGPVWRKYRNVANPMLLENDNVLLLKPAHPGSGFRLSGKRPPIGDRVRPAGLVVSTIYYLGSNSGTQFDGIFEKQIRPIVESDGASIRGTFTSNRVPNNFPKLPIRSDANVFAWVGCFASESAYNRYASRLADDPRWWTIEGNFALASMYVPPEVDLLEAGPRSQLNCEDNAPGRV